MKYSIFILGTVLLWSGQIFSQQVKNENVFDRLYFKAGVEFYSLQNTNSNIKGDVNDISIVGSIIYDFRENIQLEFVYKYGLEKNYSLYHESILSGNEIISRDKDEAVTDYNIDLKLNYFPFKDKTENPVYLTAMFEFDIQKISNNFQESRLDTSRRFQTYYKNQNASYNRLLIGPGYGAGIFLAFGKINFQAEINSVFRIAPSVDSGYREVLLNIITGLVYKF